MDNLLNKGFNFFIVFMDIIFWGDAFSSLPLEFFWVSNTLTDIDYRYFFFQIKKFMSINFYNLA